MGYNRIPFRVVCMHNRSLTEYCSTSFHSSLTKHLRNKIEAIQKICLRVFLGVIYVKYTAALDMCGLEALNTKRAQEPEIGN